jgi:hypothetical protein
VEEEQELVTALHDIRSGNYEDGLELLRELKELTRRWVVADQAAAQQRDSPPSNPATQ